MTDDYALDSYSASLAGKTMHVLDRAVVFNRDGSITIRKARRFDYSRSAREAARPRELSTLVHAVSRGRVASQADLE